MRGGESVVLTRQEHKAWQSLRDGRAARGRRGNRAPGRSGEGLLRGAWRGVVGGGGRGGSPAGGGVALVKPRIQSFRSGPHRTSLRRALGKRGVVVPWSRGLFLLIPDCFRCRLALELA